MSRTWMPCLLSVLIAMAIVPSLASAQKGDKDEDEKLTIRFYPVQDLLMSHQGYRFNGHILPGIDTSSERGAGPPIGRLQADDESVVGADTTADNPHGIDPGDLLDVITIVVEPEGWSDFGGQNVIDYLGGQLVVRATSSVHKELADFLVQARATNKSRMPLDVEAYWFRVDRDKAATFPKADAELKALLQNGQPNVAGRIQCLNGQTVTLATGTRQTVTTDVIPVVGGTSSAYQPLSVFPNIGTLLEVKPMLMHNDSQVMIDVHSTVSKVNGQSTKRQHGEIELDDTAIDAHQICTTSLANVGELFVAGGLATADAGSAADSVQTIFLVLRVTKK